MYRKFVIHIPISIFLQEVFPKEFLSVCRPNIIKDLKSREKNRPATCLLTRRAYFFAIQTATGYRKYRVLPDPAIVGDRLEA